MRNKIIFGVSELPKVETFDTGNSGPYRNKNRTFEVRKFLRNLPKILPKLGSENGVRYYTGISENSENSGQKAENCMTSRKFRSKSDQTS